MIEYLLENLKGDRTPDVSLAAHPIDFLGCSCSGDDSICFPFLELTIFVFGISSSNAKTKSEQELVIDDLGTALRASLIDRERFSKWGANLRAINGIYIYI